MAKKRIPEVAEAFGEEIDETQEIEATEPIVVEEPVSAPVAAPAAAMSMTAADITAIVKAAIEASQSGNQQIADIVTQGIAQARKPIPEGTDASNPRISTLNPLGERDHPRPGLKCEFYLGVQDAKTKQIHRTYPWIADDLTANEQIALNTLEQWDGEIERADGAPLKVNVVPINDVLTDKLHRMVVVVPFNVLEKGSQVKNMLPSITSMVAQITGKNFAKLSKDDLAWFMAEHRSGRYVSERQTVAA